MLCFKSLDFARLCLGGARRWNRPCQADGSTRDHASTLRGGSCAITDRYSLSETEQRIFEQGDSAAARRCMNRNSDEWVEMSGETLQNNAATCRALTNGQRWGSKASRSCCSTPSAHRHPSQSISTITVPLCYWRFRSSVP